MLGSIARTDPNGDGDRLVWAISVVAIAALIGSLVTIFWSSIHAMVDVWQDSATFNHCFLVIPVVLWLIVEQRHSLKRLVPVPCPTILVALVPVALLWLVGNLATVLEVQEFAVVVMFQVTAVAIFGLAITRILWFPIAFLLFMVPFGEWAVPLLQQVTATLAVSALDAAGVPVYSDGLLIEIPEGKFFVAEACAGMRFLVATMAFGTLFCWFNFRSPRRIALFLAATMVVPILANSIRAFGIVIIGHLYGTSSAVLADHVLYGWGFFALITVLLTVGGLMFREPANDSAPRETALRRPWTWTAAVGIAAILLAGGGPAIASLIALRDRSVAGPPTLTVPMAALPWKSQAASDWHPDWHAPDTELGAAFAADGPPVELRIAYVTHQRKGAEAIGFANQLARSPGVTLISQGLTTVVRPDGPLEVAVSRVSADGGSQLIWHWYWVDGRFTASGVVAKIHQVAADLLGRNRAAALVVLSTDDDRQAAARLRDLLNHLPPVADTLMRASH